MNQTLYLPDPGETIPHVETVVAPATVDGCEGPLATFIYYRPDRASGTTFLTGKNDPLQVGIVKRQAGDSIPVHVHLPRTRVVYTTQEVLVVQKGRIRVRIGTRDGSPVAERELTRGDVVILIAGSHGFVFLEDAEILEVKQGPYSPGMDKYPV